MLRMISLLTILLSATPATANELNGVASVIDGDTVEIRGTRIRLHGIDAPESRQLCTRPSGQSWRCGQQAALALSDRIGRRSVICVARDTDSYSRCHPRLHPFGQFEYHGKYAERVVHG